MAVEVFLTVKLQPQEATCSCVQQISRNRLTGWAIFWTILAAFDEVAQCGEQVPASRQSVGGNRGEVAGSNEVIDTGTERQSPPHSEGHLFYGDPSAGRPVPSEMASVWLVTVWLHLLPYQHGDPQ